MNGKREKILIVDDMEPLAEYLDEILTLRNYQCVAVTNAFEAIEKLKEGDVNLVISDINMPEMSGIELLKRIKDNWQDTAVIMMTGYGNTEIAVESMKMGAYDYIPKPINNMDELFISVKKALDEQSLVIENRAYQRELEEKQEKLEEKQQELEKKVEEQTRNLRETYLATLEFLVSALGFRDKETKGHCRRVAEYTLLIAKRMGVNGSKLDNIERGALLHDVGKIGIPDKILHKPGPLDDNEWKLMRQHPKIGYDMLIEYDFLNGAAPIALYHHEYYDGSGYPNGASNTEIPLGARIFAVVDALDAMTSERPYREAIPTEEAYEEVEKCSGTQFDPEIVSVFISIDCGEFNDIRERIEDQVGPEDN